MPMHRHGFRKESKRYKRGTLKRAKARASAENTENAEGFIHELRQFRDAYSVESPSSPRWSWAAFGFLKTR